MRAHGIIDDKWLNDEAQVEPATVFNAEIFTADITLESFRKLVRAVEYKFNGKLFPIAWGSRRAPRADAIRTVARVFAGEKVTGQMHLSFKAYDFASIPVEFICSIYEQFLHAKEVEETNGNEFFAGRVVQIDFANEKIRLLENCSPGANAEVLPLQIEAARLRVPIEVVGLGKAWARLDTGCASALHWAVSATALAGERSSEELGVGVSSLLIRENAKTVRLGNLTLNNISTGLHTEKLLAGEAGLLGTGLLSHFATVTIDEPAGRLVLERLPSCKLSISPRR